MANDNQKQNHFGRNKAVVKNDTFLEALRELGTDITSSASNDLFKKGTKDIFDSLSPFTPTKDVSQVQSNSKEGNIFSQQTGRKTEYVSREQTLLFSREQREVQKQVVTLQHEIKELAKVTGEIAKEAQVSAMQETPAIGTYHKNFFENLIKIIRSLRSQLQESSFWLSSWNKKAQKKNFYWNQTKKSGSSFMLHNDRSVATQTG